MDTRFRLEPAIGVRPRNLVRGRPDARLVARRLRLKLDLVALPLGPAHIHPRQHRGPVAAFGAAGARVDLEERVVAVGLAVEQRLKLLLVGKLLEGLHRAFGLGDDILVALHLAEFDQLDIVLQLALDPPVGLDLVHQHLAVAHQFLRPRRVGPEIAILDHGIHLLKAMRRGFPVHPLAKELQRPAHGFRDIFHLGAHGRRPFLIPEGVIAEPFAGSKPGGPRRQSVSKARRNSSCRNRPSSG